MNENIFLSVIIPAYNEEKAIKGTLEEVSGYINKRNFNCEVIVVDDGSLDKTFDRAREASQLFKNFKVMQNTPNRGKGYSVKRGMFSACGKYALFMDADNSTSIYEFDKFLLYLEKGCDIVIASRRMEGSCVEEPQPFLRARMGECYILLSKMLLRLNINDFNCGFKAYNTGSTRCIFELQRMDGWSFDVELLFLAAKYGLKVKEVPVRWVHKSGSKVKPVKDAIGSFINVLKIKLNDISSKYRLDKTD